MLGFRSLTIVAVTTCLSLVPTSVLAHPLPEPHVNESPQVFAEGLTFGYRAPAAPASRHLRAEHNGEDHGAADPTGPTRGQAISPGGGGDNPYTGAKNPGGILGPFYAAYPQLLAPLAMASDTVHNSNAAVSGVQHTPDGIFQA